MANLTAKQRAFINHYIITLNGVESARLAGYKGSYQALGVIAHENLKKPKIKAAIEERMKASAMAADEVLYRLKAQAEGTLEHFIKFNDDGTFWVDLKQAKDAGVLHLAKEIKQDKVVTSSQKAGDVKILQTTYKTQIKIHDSQAALDKLMRYHGLYNDKIKMVTWQDEIVEALRNGDIKPEAVRTAYPDLATEFFRKAGIDV